MGTVGTTTAIYYANAWMCDVAPPDVAKRRAKKEAFIFFSWRATVWDMMDSDRSGWPQVAMHLNLMLEGSAQSRGKNHGMKRNCKREHSVWSFAETSGVR